MGFDLAIHDSSGGHDIELDDRRSFFKIYPLPWRDLISRPITWQACAIFFKCLANLDHIKKAVDKFVFVIKMQGT
jgi:hypothetical protein